MRWGQCEKGEGRVREGMGGCVCLDYSVQKGGVREKGGRGGEGDGQTTKGEEGKGGCEER